VLAVRHDGGGCLTEDTVLVRASIIDNSLELLGKPVYCADSGDSSKLLVHPTAGIQWYKDNQPVVGAIAPAYRVTQSGAYYAALINSDGCKINTTTQVVTIDQPRPGITYPVQYAIENLPLELKARQFGDIAIWTPPTSLNNRTTYTPTFNGRSDQLYTIEISKRGGCLTVDTQFVKIIKKVDIFVPNAFTPNNDKHNDVLRPILRGVKQIAYFRVYNRWGNLLYESNSAESGWNGMLNGVPQPSQAVVWIVEGIGVDGKIYRQKGTTVLLR
jgi:gliding motility-associated-like protein